MSHLLKTEAVASAATRTISLNKIVRHPSAAVSCEECCMQRLCLAANIDGHDLAALESLIDHWHPMPKDRHIVREGDVFNAVFLVRSGSVKTCKTLANGEEHITGFYFPGEMFGLDGLAGNLHANTAVTMETTSLCALPLQRLSSHQTGGAGVGQRLLLLLSELLNRKDEHAMMLSKNKAHERIASFLRDLSFRFERRRLSSVCFYLPMSRTDVSRYLGLSVESVSRAFARLEKDGVIKSNGRMIEIVDSYALTSLAGAMLEPQRQFA